MLLEIHDASFIKPLFLILSYFYTKSYRKKRNIMKTKYLLLLLISTYTYGASWKPGIDVLTNAQFKQLLPTPKKPRIGLITNHTGKTLNHKRTIDALRSKSI